MKTQTYKSIIPILSTLLFTQLNAQVNPQPPKPPKSPKHVTVWARNGNYKQARITKEYNISSNTDILIESAYRNIEIKTWSEPKVKIVADYFYNTDAEKTYSDDEALKQAGITVNNEGNTLQIQATSMHNSGNKQMIYFKPNNFSMGSINKMSLKALDNLNMNLNVDSLVNNTMQTFTFNYDTLFNGLDTVYNNMNFNFDSSSDYKNWDADKQKKFQEAMKIKAQRIKERQREAQKRQKEAQQRAREMAKQSQELQQRAREMAKRDKEKAMSDKEVKELTDNAMKIADEAVGTNYGSGMSYNYVYTRSQDSSKHLIIYIPEDHSLEIDNKYGNISIASDVNKLRITTKYGNVETGNINKLELNSSYGNLNLNNVQSAKLDLSNDRIAAHDVGTLQIESKYCAVDLNKVDKITLNSKSDDYDIEETGSISGQKDYGNLRISQLNNSMDLTGASANLKVRNVSPNVSLIKIENKYADMRIAVPDTKNYNIKVTGSYNTVYPTTINNTSQSGNEKIKIDCTSCKVDLR